MPDLPISGLPLIPDPTGAEIPAEKDGVTGKVAVSALQLGNATASQAGLMTGEQYSKLEGVEAGAEKNKINTISVNGSDVPVVGGNAAITVTADGEPIPPASATEAGLMSAADYIKLDDVETGAQVNVIETIQVNGVAQPITGKTVNIPVSGDGGAVSPPTGFEGKIMSILGDSISTFSGYMLPGRPSAQYPSSDITSVDQTYWMGLINDLGAVLGVNEAYGGCRVTNGHPTATPATDQTRINNLGNNGVPDHIIAFVGINDFTTNVPMGKYDGRGALPVVNSTNLGTFREAYAIMINRIQLTYPMAQVWVCTFPGLNVVGGSGFPETRPDGLTVADWCDAVAEVCTPMGCRVIALSQCGMHTLNTANFTKDGIHPNAAGMKLIKEQMYGQMISRSTISGEKTDLTPVNNSLLALNTQIADALARIAVLESGEPPTPVNSQPLSALPVGATIVDPGWVYNGEPVEWIVSDKGQGSQDSGYPPNAVTLVSKYAITFKAIDGTESTSPESTVRSAGYGRYDVSNLGSWLNSNEVNWYTPRHAYDAPPNVANVAVGANAYDAEPGFLTNLSAAFRSKLLPANITTLLHESAGGGSETTERLIYLPSLSEFSPSTAQGVEGYCFEYFGDVATVAARRTARPTPGALAANNYASKPAAGAAIGSFLRTPGGLSSQVCGITNAGAISGYISAFAGATTGSRVVTNIRNDTPVGLTPNGNGAYELV